MTRPPCLRLCPAYPGNPRNRIEGESPHSRKKDIRSSLHPGYKEATERHFRIRALGLGAKKVAAKQQRRLTGHGAGEHRAPDGGIRRSTNAFDLHQSNLCLFVPNYRFPNTRGMKMKPIAALSVSLLIFSSQFSAAFAGSAPFTLAQKYCPAGTHKCGDSCCKDMYCPSGYYVCGDQCCPRPSPPPPPPK